MKNKGLEKYDLLKNEPTKRQFSIDNLSDYWIINSKHSGVPHSHSFYQIIWFKSDEGAHYIDFEGYEIKKNRIFFVAKNQVHYFVQRKDYKGYLLHFNESFLLNNETDVNFFLTYCIFNNQANPYFQIPKALESTLSKFLDLMVVEIENNSKFGNSLILSNLLKSMLLIIEREMKKNQSNSPLINNSNYHKFIDLLEKNYANNWSVSDYANALSISTKTLNSLVKATNGTKVSKTISARIILEAKRKLTHSKLYINQIANDLGFNDPYYFSKYFLKHVNCSPAEFRKSIS